MDIAKDHSYAKSAKAAVVVHLMDSHMGAHNSDASGDPAARTPNTDASQAGGAANAAGLEQAEQEEQQAPEIEGRPRGFNELPTLRVNGNTQFGNKTIRTRTWTPTTLCTSLPEFLQTLEETIARFLVDEVFNQTKPFKILADISLEYAKLVDDKLESKVKAVLRTKAMAATPGQDASALARRLCDTIWERNQNFIANQSGLVVFAIHWGKVTIGAYNPLLGAAFVELPAKIKAKNAVINVKNTDERCFGYAILACKYNQHAYKKQPGEPKQYDKYFRTEGLDTIHYPVAIAQLGETERVLRIPVNVFCFTDDTGDGLYPAYLSQLNRKEAINLLYWRGHYSWIKSFSRLMSGVTKHQGRKYFCMQCLGHFSTQGVLDKHEQLCSGDVCQQVTTMMPEGSTLRFNNVRYQQRCPFVVYADFECTTEHLLQENKQATKRRKRPRKTDPLDIVPEAAYQVHKPCSVGLLLTSTLDANNPKHHYEQHFGDDSPGWFLKKLVEIEEECMAVLLDPRRLVMTPTDEERFQAAQDCYICRKEFRGQNIKVRDHDHVTGKFRGAAHQSCNLQLRTQYKIPVFFHNFRGYDSHLLVAALGEKARADREKTGKERKLRVIGQGMEKYLIMSYGNHIVIKDSLQFMTESLENLTTCLRRGGDEKFHMLRREFADIATDQSKWQLLLRKGVYPYDYMDSIERFAERRLPRLEDFFSRLRQEPCKPEDYAHAETVWREFGHTTMKDYHDLYLKIDVLLLADIFEAFRDVCLKNYELDPAHYVSSPHLSWDAMLKCTECELELLSDPEMYRLLESGLRGGVAMVSKRYAKANNPRVSDYDPTKPETHLMYWDANNLYGWSMSQSLPECGFRWLDDDEIKTVDWLHLEKDDQLGYVVECDLDYPEELHDEHSDYPLAPERLTVKSEMWSGTQHKIYSSYRVGEDHVQQCRSSAKLVPNLYPKTRYCLHSRNLKFYLEHGMTLTKVHRVIQFRQRAWMKVYIEKNQDLRANSTSDFEKNFYKLMNNACYGKTCENQRKRTNIQLVTDPIKAQKLLGMPHLIGFRVFTSEIAALELMKPRCVINRPFYAGFAVLELAKLHMYKFHYDFVKKLWPGKVAQLLFTDTDSLMYEIEDSQMHEKVWQHRDQFDLSDYPSNFYHDATNKAKIGKFKDEAKGKAAEAFVGLRAKMYCWKMAKALPDNTFSVEEKARAKGIQRAAMRDLRFADYERQIRAPQEHTSVNRRIGTHLQRIYTYEYVKKGLCAFDDKRYILEDGITTLAYGHHRVQLQQQLKRRAITATDVESVQTFKQSHHQRQVKMTDLIADDDDDDDDQPSVLEVPRAARATVFVRPGFDPEQVEWQTRQELLRRAFGGDENPDDMLDLLAFVQK